VIRRTLCGWLVALFCSGLCAVALLSKTAHAAPEGKLQAPNEATPKKVTAKDDDPLQELVLAAMKAPTTVAEAPAILSVLDGSAIREQGYARLGHAIGSIPGFLRNDYAYGTVTVPITRAMAFGSLVLLDGLDLYDALGFTLITDTLPVEVIDRVEAVSGPGGVLWGANSFVGVLSIVTHTGETFEGVEASAAYGSGVNERHRMRAYVMAGGKFFKDQLKLFGHLSFETRREHRLEVAPNRLLIPNLNPGDTYFGPATTNSALRSYRFNLIGNAVWGPWSVHARLPINYIRPPFDQTSLVPIHRLPEDNIDCTNPANKTACQARVDPFRKARDLVYRPELRSVILRFRKL
jgi:outer membrane receptor protein involved in Fe transport